MDIKSKYSSPLELKSIEIIECAFKKNSSDLKGIELGVKVARKINDLENNDYEILLDTIVSDESEKLFVKVRAKALFHTELDNRDMIEKNTIAIMFPYVRSYISIVTTQPGMPPIVLPAMNIIAMLDDQNERE